MGKTEVSSEAGDSVWIFSQAFDGVVGVVLLRIHLSSSLGRGARARRSGDSAQSCNQQERCLKPSKRYFIIVIRIFGGAE